jgi:PmbA protein
MDLKKIIPGLKKFRLWEVFIYESVSQEFVCEGIEEGNSINKNKLKKEVKERKRNVVAIRFSDGRNSGFFAQDFGKKFGKNQISLDKPISEQKLEIPRCATKKIRASLGENKDVNQENIDELLEILFQKADFKLVIDKVSVGKTTQTRRIVNSKGLDLVERKTLHFIYGAIGGEKNGQRQIVYFSEYFLFPSKISPHDIAKKILADFNFDEVRLKAGKFKVIFPPKVAAQIIEFMIENFSADRIISKLSRFTERDLGKKVFSDSLSIFELAYPSFDSISGFNKKVQEELKFAPGLAYFDDEGEEKKNFPIIKSGVIENFITHALSAKKLNIQNTACAVRPNPLSPPIPAISSLVILPGDESKEKYYSFSDVILISEIIGLHTSDPIKGDFSVGCRGYIPSAGKGFKNTTISGNIFELLKNPIIFDDLSIEGKILTPSILLEGVQVS